MQGVYPTPDVRIEADFIVPDRVYDDFNREAFPAETFLRYKLNLRYVEVSEKPSERIELLEESLTYIQKGDARSELGFLCLPAFRESAIKNKRRGAGFISTVHENGNTTIKLHQDGGSWGRPFQVPATASPKTIVCGINTNDYPTILAARREMQSWTLLQLEPSALRQPDAFSADSHLAANGAHMAATLLRLDAKAQVANRLADFLDDVGSVYVERDESRRTYTLHVSGRDEIGHPARSLSDGTLRFLALAILSADPESGRLLCLEEPENGIHPLRIPAILQLLRDMAVDAGQTVSPENPLRQVIINTHSPKVVPALAIDDLLVAGLVRQKGFSRTVFQCVKGSWRASQSTLETVPLGRLLDYLEGPTDELTKLDSPIDSVRQRKFKPTVREYVGEYASQLEFDFHGESSA